MNDQRRGFSAVDFLVLVLLCVLILALVVPSIQQTRKRTRPVCLNRLRNIAFAVHSQSYTHQRMTPQATYLVKSVGGRNSVTAARSWVVDIFPYLDLQAEHSAWNSSVAWDHEDNRPIAQLAIALLTCPQDESVPAGKAGLSFALNCGIGDADWQTETGTSVAGFPTGHHPSIETFDWDGNGQIREEIDCSVTRNYMANWPAYLNDNLTEVEPFSRHQPPDVYDGSGNTILLMEAANVGRYSTESSWANPDLSSNAFYIPVDSGEFPSTENRSATIIRNDSMFVNDSPRIGNFHDNVFSVALFDGSARTLSRQISEDVLLRMLTPCGTRLMNGNRLPESPLSSDKF